ncbi:MAG: glycosyltransferase family 39 protein, partial [Leptospiraceae bacterium]|nr:glycosyltransferase family 39 protein [Leptospiraceae bacterium]
MNTRTGKIGQLAENRLWSSVFLGILSLAVLLPGTGTPEVLGQGDETMHIATIEQSLVRQSYLIPSLEHAPNFYKPPLLFWISMASAAVAGDDLLGVRLPSVIFALFAVILVYLMLRDFRMNAIIALMIAVAYLFSLAVFKFGRLLMFEQAMALSVILICFFFGRYLLSGKRLYVVLAGIVSALSFMYKGPIFQVYSGLLLLSWALVHLLRVKPNPWRWPGKKKIREILIVAVLFHVPMILPLIWLVYLSTASLMQDVSGFDWIAYFFIAENLAKFRESNQPAGRLLQGWLLYSLPWTPILIVMVVAAFRTSIRTNRQLAGWIFLIFTINVTLLHLIPHRKDPYYVVPFVPALFVAIGLLLKSRVMYFHRAARLQQVFLLIVSLLFIMSGVYFYAEWWFWVVIPIVITIQIAI